MTRIIASSDEFTYEMHDDQWVVIVDGEDTIRLTIPFDILSDLSEQVCHFHKRHPMTTSAPANDVHEGWED